MKWPISAYRGWSHFSVWLWSYLSKYVKTQRNRKCVLVEHTEWADGHRPGNCRRDCGLNKPLQIGHILEAFFRTGLEPRFPGSWLRRPSQCALMNVSCLQRTGWWHVWTKCEKSQKELSWPVWARWPAVEDPWPGSCLAEPAHSSIFPCKAKMLNYLLLPHVLTPISKDDGVSVSQEEVEMVGDDLTLQSLLSQPKR